MSRIRAVSFVAVVCLLYAAWGALYIQRTSIVLDETRIFTLWDDAMISMRYAENLSRGDGLVWNAGEEPVQGYTNLGLTLLMAGVHGLPVSQLKISLVVQLLNLAALLGILVLVWRTCEDLFPTRPGIALSAVLGTALSAPLGIWGLQGAETTLVAVWLLVPVAVAARSSRVGSDWPHWLWAWVALGPVIRLDCLLFVAVFVLGSALQPGNTRRSLLLGSASAVAVTGAVLAFSALYYGDPLPNTFYLKSTGTPQLQMLKSGAVILVTYWPGLLVPLAIGFWAAFRYRSEPLVLLIAALVAVIVLYTVKVGGDWAPHNGLRFIVPVLPLLLILTSAGCWAIVGGTGKNATAEPLRPLALSSALFVALILNPLPALVEWFNPSAPTMYHGNNHMNVRLALYFARYSAPETRIAVHWGGVPPYFSGRPAVDVLGKSDRHIARLEVTRFHPGHSKWSWEYTLGVQRPDVFLIATRGLEDRHDFRSSFYGVKGAHGLNFYVRKDAVSLLLDRSLEFRDLETGASVARD